MLDRLAETRPWAEQLAVDAAAYRTQLAYLFERSAFYRAKLGGSAREAGGLDEIAQLPLTGKDELRATTTSGNPIGAHLCADPGEIVRIYSTSGTTGVPSYIPLTAGDLDNWITGSARSYAASGIAAGQRIVSTYNAGPFVAGAALASFERLGVCHIPVGTGNTERLLTALELLRPDAVVLTPSYAAHLAERADLRESSVRRVLVAGEPGGGEPAFRAQLEAGWGARVTEAMGIGDIGPSLWGECEEQDGMHLGARGFVHAELIDPPTGAALAMDDGATGELVLTHLRHQAAPLLRFRTRDHVLVRMGECPCGRTGPRIRCVGRTDDMLIVRGVNVFPSAVREVVSGFPEASGHVLDPPAHRRREAGPAAPDRGRAGPRRDGRRRAGRGDPRAAAGRTGRPDAGGSRTVGHIAAQRVQIEAGGAVIETMVVGSYPQPRWLIDRDRLGDRLPPRVRARELWRVAEPFLEAAQDDATRLAVRDMELAGVHVITDGEMRRESYSNRFATALDGVDLDNPGTALDRTGHPNPVPRVAGPVRRREPVEVRDVEFLRSITDRRIKITVPGPFTMTQQAQNDHYADDRSLALAYAEAVNEELHDLKAAGADVVQIDEPYLQARPEPAREYAVEAIDRALDGIDGDTVLHTCFGYAHIVHTRLPGYPFLGELNGCAATHVSIEAAQPGLDPEVLRGLPDKTIVLGVLDLGSPEAETAEVVSRRGSAARSPSCPAERLVVAPDCGMKYLSRDLAFAKLRAMVAGAALVRAELPR